MANTMSYQQATSSCKSDGKEVCSSKVICKDRKTPYGGIKSGDHWVPVADSFNEWIQIGRNVCDILKRYSNRLKILAVILLCVQEVVHIAHVSSTVHLGPNLHGD